MFYGSCGIFHSGKAKRKNTIGSIEKKRNQQSLPLSLAVSHRNNAMAVASLGLILMQ